MRSGCSDLPLLAVDVPTGLDADTGAVDPHTPRPAVTLALGYPKLGMFAVPGAESVGTLEVLDIGLPSGLDDDVQVELMTAASAALLAPLRPLAAHKGSFGRALILAGSPNYVGAARLAALAATRVGAGLVTLAIPAGLQPSVAAGATEPTFIPLPESSPGFVEPERAASLLLDAMEDYDSLLIGCGLGQDDRTRDLLERLLLGGAPIPPAVVDADALNFLASRSDAWSESFTQGAVLTPHPGEMSRLTGETVGPPPGRPRSLCHDRRPGVGQGGLPQGRLHRRRRPRRPRRAVALRQPRPGLRGHRRRAWLARSPACSPRASACSTRPRWACTCTARRESASAPNWATPEWSPATCCRSCRRPSAPWPDRAGRGVFGGAPARTREGALRRGHVHAHLPPLRPDEHRDDRGQALRLATPRLPPRRRLADRPALDVAAGTCDFAFDLARIPSVTRVAALDFAPAMLHVAARKARRQGLENAVDLVAGDAHALPFEDDTFICATVGFGVRNFIDQPLAVRELARVVRPGGRVAILEIVRTDEEGAWGRAFPRLFGRVAPALGAVFAGEREAYTYLPESVDGFASAPQLAIAHGRRRPAARSQPPSLDALRRPPRSPKAPVAIRSALPTSLDVLLRLGRCGTFSGTCGRRLRMTQYRLPYRMMAPSEDTEDMYMAEVPALPGCRAWGETPEDAMANLRSVAAQFIASYAEHGDELPDSIRDLADNAPHCRGVRYRELVREATTTRM